MRGPRTTPGTRAGGGLPVAPPARGRRAHAGRAATEDGSPGDAIAGPVFGGSGGGSHAAPYGRDTDPYGRAEAPYAPDDARHGRAERNGREGASAVRAAPSWWRPRSGTVRAKIVCLLLIPVLSLLVLWTFAAVGTAQDVARLRQAQRVEAEIRTPVATSLNELQQERTAAARYLAAPTPTRRAELDRQGRTTDRAAARLRSGPRRTVADAADLPAAVTGRLETYVGQLARLKKLRSRITERGANWGEVYRRYTVAADSAFGVGGALSGVPEASAGSGGRVLLEFSRARELLAREHALLSAAQLTGSLEGDRLRGFAGAVEARRVLEPAAAKDLRAADRARWRTVRSGGAYEELRALEDEVLAGSAKDNVADAAPPDSWGRAYDSVQRALGGVESAARTAGARHTDPYAGGVLTPSGAAVAFGLAALVASLLISVRIGRGLVAELVGLRDGALDIARRKLPGATRRLRAGESLDVNAEAPPGDPADDEIAQVRDALGTVHRAALRAAVERAELADGVSGDFVNLARRSQVLVHRQLALLDSMERRADDPGELGDLFRLDHLTTRMRRHAESLIILSGAAPGRAWRMPVTLMNLVRSAVSEVEDYARVEVGRLPKAALDGSAVADLVHLLAELIENAAQFSPPHTKVRISGEEVGSGLALEIEDRGLGMGAEALFEANRRIRRADPVDLFDSDRLGLFAVSRLAARQGARVVLRTSPYGGTTAVVLLPSSLVNVAEPTGDGGGMPPKRMPGMNGATGGSEGIGVTGRENGGVVGGKPNNNVPTPVDTEEPAELPRRVRQTHLAPQLREISPQPGNDDAERTPERVRERMTAYRDGWARGAEAAPYKARAADSGGGAGSGAADGAGDGEVVADAAADDASTQARSPEDTSDSENTERTEGSEGSEGSEDSADTDEPRKEGDEG
ncbi:sensor histidine kinase [Streptomyces sp. H27-D2]|uniref:sensor histidine kinase n=1 Tax=Streptomyces sp. H27-D2 TaxID=3046304 RepID=UPI002DBBADD5|nr:nitrate- and nitrite sensing domain-containing protein [Streptomyces sp. H27-D2]MEC4020408.1 nitrate- and nitrite sensing domain-containing protein [Streptomyces sp. H27-D2]